MAVWALNVNKTDPLVVTAGSALETYPWWTSQELQQTSGTHFSDVSILRTCDKKLIHKKYQGWL